MKKLICFLVFLMISITVPIFADFDFDDLEELDRMEQTNLLELARQAAEKWNFSKAESYLDQARNKSYNPAEVKDVKALIAENRKTYEAEQERKQKEEERKKREEEQQRAADERAKKSGSQGLYITSWGNDFSNDFRIWGRTGVKLSNGSEIYFWLDHSDCYNITMMGGYIGNASNCSDSPNGIWVASTSGSGNFTVSGSPSDVVQAMVKNIR